MSKVQILAEDNQVNRQEATQDPAVGGEMRGGGRRQPERSAPPTAGLQAKAHATPNPEVSADRPRRRLFNFKYKRKILEEADNCTEQGMVGALLRREGLYYSHLCEWRRLRNNGTNTALATKKRGRKVKVADALATRVKELERDKQQLEERLRKAEIIIDVQKKVSQLLGIPLPPPGKEENR